jgi:hypothetical protein
MAWGSGASGSNGTDLSTVTINTVKYDIKTKSWTLSAGDIKVHDGKTIDEKFDSYPALVSEDGHWFNDFVVDGDQKEYRFAGDFVDISEVVIALDVNLMANDNSSIFITFFDENGNILSKYNQSVYMRSSSLIYISPRAHKMRIKQNSLTADVATHFKVFAKKSSGYRI